MFVYSLAKAVNDGDLPRDYLQPARRGYQGLTRQLIRIDAAGEVNLTQCCKVAGLGQPASRDGSFPYYISEPVIENDSKCVGPFIRAGIELQRFNAQE